MAILNLEKNTILIVEDDDMSFLYLNQIFKLTKSSVIRAKNGSEAIQVCRDNDQIDLVLMDIQLPDFDGNRVTREIRKFNNKLPIIAQTAGKTQYDKDNALESGCNDVLIKPFKMEELMLLLLKYLGDEERGK
ncbi:MAG: response regulator [Bacteroidales bacterium]|nr:response regulator [Bacteroidales bacterium]